MTFRHSCRLGDFITFAFAQGSVFPELKSAAEKGLSKAQLLLLCRVQGMVVPEEV